MIQEVAFKPDFIENELGIVDIHAIYFIVFFIFIIASLFMVINITLASNMRGGTQQDISGEAQNLSGISKVQVSAEVPYVLGTKKVSEDNRGRTIMIFGNDEKGFSVFDCTLSKTIYGQDKMPGDGVLINVPKEVQNVCLMTYY